MMILHLLRYVKHLLDGHVIQVHPCWHLQWNSGISQVPQIPCTLEVPWQIKHLIGVMIQTFGQPVVTLVYKQTMDFHLTYQLLLRMA